MVINKRRRSAIKDVIRIIEQEAYEYSDPITEFLEALFVQYDFEGAQQMLLECEVLIENDYFLTAIKEVGLFGVSDPPSISRRGSACSLLCSKSTDKVSNANSHQQPVTQP